MPRRSTPLYFGTNRFVAAVNSRTGEELWRTRLPHGGGSIVTVLVGRAYLFAGHAGHVYCLDKRLGSVLWENDLPKMGYHTVLLAIEAKAAGSVEPLYVGTNRFVAALHPRTGAERWRTRLPHSGGAVVTVTLENGRLFAGHAGYLYGLDKRSGEILWENGLPRMGFHSVIPAGVGGAGIAAAAVAAHAKQQQQQAASTTAATGS